MRFKKGLTVYKVNDFLKVLNSKSFYFHHKNNAHLIYANPEGYYVTVPIGDKEINAMMSTVCLQRIDNQQCRKLDRYTIEKYKDSYFNESGLYINLKS